MKSYNVYKDGVQINDYEITSLTGVINCVQHHFNTNNVQPGGYTYKTTGRDGSLKTYTLAKSYYNFK